MNNLNIPTKIYICIAVVSVVLLTVAGIGYNSITTLKHATENITLAATEIRIGARLNQDAVELNRSEYRLATEPEAVSEVRGVVEQTREDLRERLRTAEATAGPEQQGYLAAAREALEAYAPQLDETIALAERFTGSEADRLALRRSVQESRAVVAELRDRVAEYVGFTDNKGEQLAEDAAASASLATTISLSVAALGLLIGAGLSYVIARTQIVAPLNESIGALRSLADNDLSTAVPGVGRGDEIGKIAAALEIFKQNAVERAEMTEREKAEAQEKAARAERLAKLVDNFEGKIAEVVTAVAGAATELQASADTMTDNAETTNQRSTVVAGAAEEASANVQAVATATEEMSNTVQEIGRQVTDSSEKTGQAEVKADETMRKVRTLSEAAQRIGDVVALISDIAEQTNLLALNATIEAARAGEAGKGFAVVASEVKQLASQTAKATTDISEQITAIQDATDSSATAIADVADMIKNLNGSTTIIASAVEEQLSATQEIAQNVQQVSGVTQEVSSNIIGVSDAASQSSAAAEQVLSASAQLAEMGETLSKEVNDFLTGVKAA
jgi:methyl-accepting chemotaxis protein